MERMKKPRVVGISAMEVSGMSDNEAESLDRGREKFL